MFALINTPPKPVHELIAASRHRSEQRMITVARRFVRRAFGHGVTIHTPPVFSGDHVLLQFGPRRVRIDMDGAIVQAGAQHDPQWRANANRLHVLDLRMAARFRRRGDVRAARRSLGLAATDRAETAPLPS